jgi:hypothetical protein
MSNTATRYAGIHRMLLCGMAIVISEVIELKYSSKASMPDVVIYGINAQLL